MYDYSMSLLILEIFMEKHIAASTKKHLKNHLLRAQASQGTQHEYKYLITRIENWQRKRARRHGKRKIRQLMIYI